MHTNSGQLRGCHNGRSLAGRGFTSTRRVFTTRAKRAFTLVEILAVIVILGIASAIIIPQIGTRDDLKAAAAARVIVADLIYAQNLAISTGSNVYIRFDKTNNNYSMVTSPNSGSSTFGTLVMQPVTQQSYIQQFGDTNAKTVDPWERVSIDTVSLNGTDPTYASQYTVGFDSIGSPYVFRYTDNTSNDLADGSKIIIKSGTLSTQINIAAATGEITVQ